MPSDGDIDTSGPYAKVRHATPWLYACNFLCGLVAPMAISPIVAIIDGAVINKVNGDGAPILQSVRRGFVELTRPWKFFREYKWQRITFYCWLVYGGTYASGNLIQTYNEAAEAATGQRSENAVWTKVIVTSIFNVGLTAWVKDPGIVRVQQYLAAQGQLSTPRPAMPMWWLPRALFCVRDLLTMYAAFACADRVGTWVQHRFDMSATSSRRIATFGVPVALQTVSTPIHLMALNLVQTPKASLGQLMCHIRRDYVSATTSRMGRIFPAIGLGSNINNELRNAMLFRMS